MAIGSHVLGSKIIIASDSGMVSYPKSGAKVLCLRGNMGHRCDLFVTCCDLMKIYGKMSLKGIKKATV